MAVNKSSWNLSLTLPQWIMTADAIDQQIKHLTQLGCPSLFEAQHTQRLESLRLIKKEIEKMLWRKPFAPGYQNYQHDPHKADESR